ncbi:GFA family protein [Microvirga sp. M8]|nr:GFA family protein [Microvirga tunisiensis]
MIARSHRVPHRRFLRTKVTLFQVRHEFGLGVRLSWTWERVMKVDGRCHCGFITFEAEIEPEKAWLCHCTDCQTLSGSAFRTVAPTREGAFTLLSGEVKAYVKIGTSGARRLHGFCPECGSPIYSTSESDGPKVYNLRVGTLSQRWDLVVKRHRDLRDKATSSFTTAQA